MPSLDETGSCASVCPLSDILSIVTSSWVKGTSTVLVSVVGSLVIVAWLSLVSFETPSFSAVNGTFVPSDSLPTSLLFVAGF